MYNIYVHDKKIKENILKQKEEKQETLRQQNRKSTFL